jgi:hypothetical protein
MRFAAFVQVTGLLARIERCLTRRLPLQHLPLAWPLLASRPRVSEMRSEILGGVRQLMNLWLIAGPCPPW